MVGIGVVLFVCCAVDGSGLCLGGGSWIVGVEFETDRRMRNWIVTKDVHEI